MKEREMVIILDSTNLCPSECKHFHVELTEEARTEYCHLPDGIWTLKLKNEQLIECPLGKWNLKAEMGFGPLVL